MLTLWLALGCKDAAVDTALSDGTLWYADADGDGFGDRQRVFVSEAAPAGYTAKSGDCDDGEPGVSPSAVEVCGDDIDEDCDGCPAACDAAGETRLCGLSVETMHGDPGARYGEVLAAADTDGDGRDELLIGAPLHSAEVAWGGALWAGASAVVGTGASDSAGGAVAGAGDVDGDGLEDVLVGAWREDTAEDADCGAAWLLYGPVTGGSGDDADARLTGTSFGAWAGRSVAGAGDVDGDGYDDLLIGAYGDDDGSSDAGAVYIVFGGVTGDLDLSAADIKLTGEDSGDYAGYAVAGAGDVDGDGLADLIIGAHRDEDGGTSSGSAYLIFGGITASTSLSGADVQLVGESNSDYAGYSVGGAGDVDGDGLDDVLIGATGEDTDGSAAGAVYVVLGGVSADLDLSAADHKITGEDTGDWVGCSVDGAGDVDGDGLSDILIGACQDEVGGSYSGSVYVVLGGLSGTVSVVDAHAELIGESGTDYAGESVSGAGDVDGDGLADFLIGARGDDDNGSNSGAAYLMLGGVSGYLDLSRADAKLAGEGGSDYAGGAVSGGGDVDGDGLADILVGAYGEGTGGSAAGGVYVVLGGGY